MRASFGRKDRPSSIGKKGQSVKKGLKGLGGALVLGAGLYHAWHSADKHHQNDEKQTKDESDALQAAAIQKHEELMEEEAIPMPASANAVDYAPSGGGVSPLDKVDDVLDVASAAVAGAREVTEAEGKFSKAKAAARAAKDLKDKAKEVGKKSEGEKLVEGKLSPEKEAKVVERNVAQTEKKLRRQDCDRQFGGSSVKQKAARKLCYKVGIDRTVNNPP
jgi:hypothetical protein